MKSGAHGICHACWSCPFPSQGMAGTEASACEGWAFLEHRKASHLVDSAFPEGFESCLQNQFAGDSGEAALWGGSSTLARPSTRLLGVILWTAVVGLKASCVGFPQYDNACVTRHQLKDVCDLCITLLFLLSVHRLPRVSSVTGTGSRTRHEA